MGFKRNKVLSSSLNAEDLDNGPVTVKVESVSMKEFEEDDGYKKEKLIVQFYNWDRRLIANKTQATALFDILGNDTDDWTDQKIVLKQGRTEYNNRQVKCVVVEEWIPVARGRTVQESEDGPPPRRSPEAIGRERPAPDREPEVKGPTVTEVEPVRRPRRDAPPVAQEPEYDDTPY